MRNKLSGKNTISGIIGFSIIIGLSIWYNSNLDKTAEMILKDHGVTTGKLTEYSPSTHDFSTRIHFRYCVDGIMYNKTISVGSDFSFCENRQYWVIYLNSNHDACMIDLSNEIRMKDQSPPKSLDKFKIPDYKNIKDLFGKFEK